MKYRDIFRMRFGLVWLLFLGGALGNGIQGNEKQDSSPKTQRLHLTAQHVGEYAAVPWLETGTPIVPNTRADRVRDLNFSVASINLKEEMSDSFLKGWADRARWGREQNKVLLPRVYFWDGRDRFEGPLRDIEVYWKRLDTFLSAMDLNDLAGIVLAEENIPYAGRPEVLRELYFRVKQKYDIAVWQWWSPMRSVPSSGGWIPADGWVIDLYFLPNPDFRRMVRKYLIAGVPLVVMPWAAQMDLNKGMTETQWNANSAQLETAIEFNLPVAFFWIYGTSANFGASRGEPQSEMDRVNHWVWNHIERVRGLPENYNGLETADQGKGDVHEIGPTEEDRLVYVDTFSNEKCVDDATMTGFRNLVMDGEMLSVRGFGGRKIESSLEYRFQGEIRASHPEVSLAVMIDPSLEGELELALSPDGENWLTKISEPVSGTQRLTLASTDRNEFTRLSDFRVRLRVTGKASDDDSPAVQIDNLRIAAGLTAPEEREVRLQPVHQESPRLEYDEQFLSQKYRWNAQLTNESHLNWSKGQVGVRLQPGGSAAVLVWKINQPQPLKNIQVRVEGHANSIHLGTNQYLDISTDGENWRHETNTVGKKGDVNGNIREPLTINTNSDPEFQNIREFSVRIRMNADSFPKKHPNLSGVVSRLLITAESVD